MLVAARGCECLERLPPLIEQVAEVPGTETYAFSRETAEEASLPYSGLVAARSLQNEIT